MSDLLPIGTIFTKDYPPDTGTTNPFPHRYTYKVRDHETTFDQFGNERGVAMVVDCIKVEQLPLGATDDQD